MGMVMVISLPFIIFCFILGFGCYFFGRARGRRDMQTNPQVYGMPAPPPGASASAANIDSQFKPDNTHQEKGRTLPKFGEWDVSDPSSGTDFSVIFNKARNERRQCGKVQLPPNTCNSPQYNPQLALRKSHYWTSLASLSNGKQIIITQQFKDFICVLDSFIDTKVEMSKMSNPFLKSENRLYLMQIMVNNQFSYVRSKNTYIQGDLY
ncbi:hypothetical protein ACSQ67_017840 [Phaseolus vulgaris]